MLLSGLFNNRDAACALEVQRIGLHHLHQKVVINVVDDVHVTREHVLKQRQGPLLQRLRQQRVVRIRERVPRDLPCSLPFQAVLIDQQAHQFGNGQRRMRIVHLNCNLLRNLT